VPQQNRKKEMRLWRAMISKRLILMKRIANKNTNIRNLFSINSNNSVGYFTVRGLLG
jgi:hypothetical protein